MAKFVKRTKFNIYTIFMISGILLMVLRTVAAACRLGEVFDPNIRKCVDCDEICNFSPGDKLCSDCRQEGNVHTDWGKYRYVYTHTSFLLF